MSSDGKTSGLSVRNVDSAPTDQEKREKNRVEARCHFMIVERIMKRAGEPQRSGIDSQAETEAWKRKQTTGENV